MTYCTVYINFSLCLGMYVSCVNYFLGIKKDTVIRLLNIRNIRILYNKKNTNTPKSLGYLIQKYVSNICNLSDETCSVLSLHSSLSLLGLFTLVPMG